MTFEIVVAAIVSALALMALPRKSARLRLAAATRTFRIQYVALILVPLWLLAILFWIDIWQRISYGSGTALQTLLIAGFLLWGLVLASTGLPGLWRGQSPMGEKLPAYWLWGRPLYRGGIRALPSIMVALLFVALSAIAIPLNQRGIIGDWLFLTLFFASVVAVLMAVSVIMFNWPTFLVPPSMRGERGSIQESLHARRQPRPPSNRTP
jgi:hypothetical protein